MKKFIKLSIVLTIIMSLFISCGTNTTGKRSTEPGIISIVSLDDAMDLANKNKESIILFTLETCKDCKIMKDVLNPYLENHELEIYEVNLTAEGTSDEEIQNNREKINTVFEEFNSVPSMYYVKDGKVIDEVTYVTEESELEEFVVNNKLDIK